MLVTLQFIELNYTTINFDVGAAYVCSSDVNNLCALHDMQWVELISASNDHTVAQTHVFSPQNLANKWHTLPHQLHGVTLSSRGTIVVSECIQYAKNLAKNLVCAAFCTHKFIVLLTP